MTVTDNCYSKNRPFIGTQYAGKYAPNEPLLNANFTPADNLP
ncbi:hypothetical protein [Moraxella osloensis]|nr:hypothetical protein [Moraxella osloensis]